MSSTLFVWMENVYGGPSKVGPVLNNKIAVKTMWKQVLGVIEVHEH